ncbi:hypothetical protein OF001_U70068 [Pseudomonas sp. OF001]|nr:hypothetical protein OF001_U70068 [Pseudomonas sp. OF001]
MKVILPWRFACADRNPFRDPRRGDPRGCHAGNGQETHRPGPPGHRAERCRRCRQHPRRCLRRRRRPPRRCRCRAGRRPGAQGGRSQRRRTDPDAARRRAGRHAQPVRQRQPGAHGRTRHHRLRPRGCAAHLARAEPRRAVLAGQHRRLQGRAAGRPPLPALHADADDRRRHREGRPRAGARRRRRRPAGDRHRQASRCGDRGLGRASGGQGADRVAGRQVRRRAVRDRRGARVRRGRRRLRAADAGVVDGASGQGGARARQAGRHRHHHRADSGPQGADPAPRGHRRRDEAGLCGHRPGRGPRRQLPADRRRSGGGAPWCDPGRPQQPGRAGAGGCLGALRTQPAGLPQAGHRRRRQVPPQPRRRHRRRLPDVRRRPAGPPQRRLIPPSDSNYKDNNHGPDLRRSLQPDHLRAGDLRRLPRGVERHPRAAHPADGGDQRHFRHRHRRRHAGRRADRNRPGQDHGHPGRGPGRSQRVRRLPGHPAHAGNVQEEGAEGAGRGALR